MAKTGVGVVVVCEAERVATRGVETTRAVTDWLAANGWTLAGAETVGFDAGVLRRRVGVLLKRVEFLIVCGGTGISSNDIVPQTLERICDYPIPGIGELLRAESLKFSLNSPLSRCGGYVCKGKLVISIPGNPTAAVEQLGILRELLGHAVSAGKGKCETRRRV